MSLIELMIAIGIMSFASIMILSLFTNLTKAYKYNSFLLSINRDLRFFTGDLTDNATFSNYFFILPDFSTRTIGTAPNLALANVADGDAGDCVVFVFKDTTDDSKIARLVGYYHDPDATLYGPLRKFDLTFTPSQTGNVWDMLPALATLHTNLDIINARMDGTAVGTSSSGRMFYNFFNRSVMIKGQLNYTSTDGMTKRAVSTYNFTVSPRG